VWCCPNWNVAWGGRQPASLRSVVQQYLCDKCPRISILLSHLCESSPVDKLMPEPHKSASHFLINLTSLMSLASCFAGFFIFQSSLPEAAVLHASLLMKGSKSMHGNRNNGWIILARQTFVRTYLQTSRSKATIC
jgi:hypothetical protein